MQEKIFKLNQLKNDIETICKNNKTKSLQDLKKQYLVEYNEIKNSYSKDIKQCELLDSDSEDIREQMINQLIGLSREIQFKAKCLNLQEPPRGKKRIWKSSQQFFEAQGGKYGSHQICREFADKKLQEAEEEIVKFIQDTYDSNFEKAYAQKVADSQEQLKRILSITEDDEEDNYVKKK